jgi:hypothetical protein
MKPVTILFALLLAVSAPAQTSTPVELTDGASIAVRLLRDIKANKAKAGDEVLAEIIVPVLDHGRIAIPGGARVIGQVVSSNGRSKENRGSALGVRFERAEWNGGSANLQAYIVGLLAGGPGKSQRDNCAPYAPRRFAAKPPLSQFQAQQGPNVLNGVGQPIHDRSSTAQHDPSMATGMPCMVAGPPDFSYISVRKLDAPRGATQLVSDTKNISLPKGITVELRQVAP